MKQVILVGCAGMIGAILRTFIGMLILEGSSFPVITLLVNLIATGALCFLATGVLSRINKKMSQVITIGFLGSFSTFSAFSIETILLVESGQVLRAIIYVLLSVVGGIGTGLVGIHFGRKWQVT